MITFIKIRVILKDSMELEKVLNELETNGLYWRGDSVVTFEEGVANLNLCLKDSSLIQQLLPNLPSEVREQIKYPSIKEIAASTQLPFKVKDGKLTATYSGSTTEEAVSPLVNLANGIQYPDVHITRRSGAYILILNGKAIYATESLIDYCPLAETLFTRHGYGGASTFQEKLLKELNEQAIGEFRMFSGQRDLRECEAKVPFGSSEVMMDAFKNGYFECAVQVCDGVGTVVTLDSESSQGVGAVMTGTFYTTPIEGLIEGCYQENVLPVFPETADIDQIAGVKAALRLGKKKIAVTTASDYNRNLDKIGELERGDIEIYRFALCSTGIDEETARAIAEHSDIAWSCASKYAKEVIEPRSLLQIGLKIPVYVMTQRGWDIVRNRVLAIDPTIEKDLENLTLDQGERYFIAHKGPDQLIVRPTSEIKYDLVDTPRPLV